MRPLYLLASFGIGCFFLLPSCGGESGTVTTEGCGNGVLDPGEECDDGNNAAGDGCEACVSTAICGDGAVQGSEECESGDDDCFPVGHVNECRFIRTAFRWNEFGVLDPKIYFAPDESCGATLSLHGILNGVLDASTNGDSPSGLSPDFAIDGVLDLGFVLAFQEIAQGDGDSSSVEFTVADCVPQLSPTPPTALGGPTPCAPTAINPSNTVPFRVTTKTGETCLAAVPGTTASPPADEGVGDITVEPGDYGCFVNEEPINLTIGLGSVVQIPLTNARIAGQWNDNPPTQILNGFAYGFISEELAQQQIIDERTQFVMGQTLAETFSPQPNCQHQDELNGVTGFWVYLKFAAVEVPWKGGLTCGDGSLDLDEVCDPGLPASDANACAPLVACPPPPGSERLLCLAECDDGLACTEDTVNIGNPCHPSCAYRALFVNGPADGCCPAFNPKALMKTGDNLGITASDPDCEALCGDGMLTEGEVCDTAIPTNNCDDVDCDDGEVCTKDFLTGCTCAHWPILRENEESDGCCPPGARAIIDPDCT